MCPFAGLGRGPLAVQNHGFQPTCSYIPCEVRPRAEWILGWRDGGGRGCTGRLQPLTGTSLRGHCDHTWQGGALLPDPTSHCRVFRNLGQQVPHGTKCPVGSARSVIYLSRALAGGAETPSPTTAHKICPPLEAGVGLSLLSAGVSGASAQWIWSRAGGDQGLGVPLLGLNSGR